MNWQFAVVRSFVRSFVRPIVRWNEFNDFRNIPTAQRKLTRTICMKSKKQTQSMQMTYRTSWNCISNELDAFARKKPAKNKSAMRETQIKHVGLWV